jgi:hypothetical protein
MTIYIFLPKQQQQQQKNLGIQQSDEIPSESSSP